MHQYKKVLKSINIWLKSTLHNEYLANCLILACKNEFTKDIQQMPMNVDIVYRDYSQAFIIWESYVKAIKLTCLGQDIEETDFALWVLDLYAKNKNDENFIELREKVVNKEYQCLEIVWCLMIAKCFNSDGEFIRYYIAKQGKDITWI